VCTLTGTVVHVEPFVPFLNIGIVYLATIPLRMSACPIAWQSLSWPSVQSVQHSKCLTYRYGQTVIHL